MDRSKFHSFRRCRYGYQWSGPCTWLEMPIFFALTRQVGAARSSVQRCSATFQPHGRTKACGGPVFGATCFPFNLHRGRIPCGKRSTCGTMRRQTWRRRAAGYFPTCLFAENDVFPELPIPCHGSRLDILNMYIPRIQYTSCPCGVLRPCVVVVPWCSL